MAGTPPPSGIWRWPAIWRRPNGAAGHGIRRDRRSAATAHPAVPPLLRSCLRLGAKVCGPPGYNEAAGTADFLLLLDLQDAEPAADLGGRRANRRVGRTGS